MSTFGDNKQYFALSAEGGVPPSDPRLIARVNEAQIALMQLSSRNFVGSSLAATAAVSGKQFSLPPEADVLIGVEETVNGTLHSSNYEITSPSIYIEPGGFGDLAWKDLGIVGGERTYQVPELADATTSVSIIAWRKFVPVVNDSTALFIDNPMAIREMMLAIDYRGRRSTPDTADKYEAHALALLAADLKGYLADPRHVGFRLAQWRMDETNYAPGTLGNSAAKLALDLSIGARIGRKKLYRLVQRAIGWCYQRRYEYQLNARNRIFNTVPEVAATPTDPTAALDPPLQHELLRQVVQACLAEDNQGLDEDRGTGKLTPGAELAISQKLFAEASAALTSQLDAELELLRRTTYETTMAELDPWTVGWMVARLALDVPGGLKMSVGEWTRLLNRAEKQLADSGRFKKSEAHYRVFVRPNGTITLPEDADGILHAKWCGGPEIEVRGREYRYLGSCWFSGGTCRVLDDAGYDDNDNRQYRFPFGWWNLTPLSGGASGYVEILARRKWVYHGNSDDILLVQNETALRAQCEAFLKLDSGSAEGFSILSNVALKALDNELAVTQEGVRHAPIVRHAGLGYNGSATLRPFAGRFGR